MTVRFGFYLIQTRLDAWYYSGGANSRNDPWVYRPGIFTRNMQRDGIDDKATFYTGTMVSSHMCGRKSIFPCANIPVEEAGDYTDVIPYADLTRSSINFQMYTRLSGRIACARVARRALESFFQCVLVINVSTAPLQLPIRFERVPSHPKHSQHLKILIPSLGAYNAVTILGPPCRQRASTQVRLSVHVRFGPDSTTMRAGMMVPDVQITLSPIVPMKEEGFRIGQ
ncbi:hypothetical protein B0H14DRAFT_2584272 [Mycena olivaceomarginata]|nr:hypothetical protein B0H14DRAFT_2584272 [Mycena olivaceomarginata]